jgi:hypothetical protein
VQTDKSCKAIAERVMQETGIESIGKVIEILLIRHSDDLIKGYNTFMSNVAQGER